jgi:hypothetical protein
MAAKTYEVVSPRRYGTRMLQAGDTIELTQPRARIYSALGYVKPHNPKKAAKPIIPTVDEVLSAEVVEPKKKPRKKAAKKPNA